LCGLDYARVAVADQRDVVVEIEEGAAGFVVKMLHPAADDFQRLVVGDAEIFAEDVAASV